MIILLVSLTAVTVSGSSVIYSKPYTRFVKRDVDSSQTSSTVHNVTMDCGDYLVRYRAVSHCMHDLRQLAYQGYPWSTTHVNIPRNEENVTDKMRDALDSLNHVCYAQDRSQRCLQEHNIRDFCLLSTKPTYAAAVEFQFICHHRQRDENLIHSLQCLYDNRLLVMLYFHIAHRCRGFSILDEMMIRGKSAYIYSLNVNPFTDLPYLPPLHCLPKHVITTCIRQLIDDYCGAMTADLVQDYLLYIQDRFSKALQSAGLASDIKFCENGIGPNFTAPMPRIPSLHGKLGFLRLLEMAAPGTALDTVYGIGLLAWLQTLSVEELCTTVPAYYAYMACVMSSDGKSEITKFNILQFAHGIIPPLIYHGSHCNRLELFTTCWNLLQEICGPKVRGLEQHATLLVEGCTIQSEMDLAGCHWQDMLLPHYIQASQVTAWPIHAQCLQSPMWLETSYHYTNITTDLERVISLLQPGVEDISKICGKRLATRVQSVLDKVRYFLYDAYKYNVLLSEAASP